MTELPDRSLNAHAQSGDLSGGRNPLHVDSQVARRTMFHQPIIHGVRLPFDRSRTLMELSFAADQVGIPTEICTAVIPAAALANQEHA